MVCALSMTGCTPAAVERTPRNVVRVAIAEPQHLLPSSTSDSAGSQVLAALYAPLVGYDGKNEPYEVAAQSVTTADNVTWTVKLKPGYTFHNGEKVTADSYLDAWNYAAYGPNGQQNSYFFERIDGYAAVNQADPDGAGPEPAPAPKTNKLAGLRKVGDLAFTVTLSAPFGGFRTMLGSTPFYPLPKAAFTPEGALRPDFEQSPIGNGPFRMKGTWRHGAPIEVERYDGYPGTQPKIQGAIFKIYGRPAAEYADLVGGDTDVVTQVPPTSVAAARDHLGDRYQRRPAAELNFLAFPAYDEEFTDPDVRRAISMAIDRDAISESVFAGAQAPARSFVAPVVAGYRADSCGAACKFDPATAKTLYAQAGGPAQLRITYNSDGGHQAWVDATCKQLSANLGVPCVGAAEPTFAAVATRLDGKQPVGMFRMRSVLSFPSMADYLTGLYSTTGASNYSGYSNPRFDQLIREGDAAAKPQDAIGKYQQAEDILAKDLPVLPVRFGQADFAYSDQVANVHTDLFDRVDLTTIEYLG
jgi:peptide/nickel transport system substrate-binding protein/oligopeptide transport system substrate-binding protein